ncbi:MAG TPA: aminopeptidase P family N-terminal domain-containing protein, partial [Candidatus Dormibacteraeota bacterium]
MPAHAPLPGPPPLGGEGASALAISAQEYADRRDAVAAGMDAAGLDALCVFYPARIAYLTGFHHIPTERPIVLILGAKGDATL